ncbi:MAG: CHAT domain-containing protein [Cyanobacteria bacterium P01_F01_bin.56]
MANVKTWFGKLNRLRRRWLYSALLTLSCVLCLWLNPLLAMGHEPVTMQLAQATLEQGQQLYQSGDLVEAAQVLEQVSTTTTNPTEEVLVLRNLALVYQQLGEWAAAETAIAEAQSVLDENALSNENALQAQVLDVQGGIQLDQGQGKAAITTWQQAIDIYQDLDDFAAQTATVVNQSQAMQQLGFHRQAIATLQPIVAVLEPAPASLTKAVALRTLGDSLIQAGNAVEAKTVLQTSLNIAETLPNAAAVSAATLSLGNLNAALGETAAALDHYREADNSQASPLVQVQAQLNQFNLLTPAEQVRQARSHWAEILATLNILSPSQATLYAKINLAQSLIALPVAGNPSPRQIADILVSTIQQAQTIGDRRSESFATGTLGHLYETQEQWSAATDLSKSALALAQANNAADITYRWQWQLGRIYKAEKQTDQAIAAYSNSIDTLQRLRTDLVAINPAVQFSFQESVEPIHRELVSLILDPSREATPNELETARETIEALQLAELDNFFREACLDAASVEIDQLDQRAAVVYPVILSDRLEIILSLPNQPLTHVATPINATDLNLEIEQLQQFLVLRVGNQYLPHAQQLYDWLIRPIRAELSTSEVDTLVFVLDGELRNIPMAVLHDGEQFLLQAYSLALTPGLQLVNPQPLPSQTLRVLTAGLSEPRLGFSALPNVVDEVTQIQETVPTAAVLLNNSFTVNALTNSLTTVGSPIVHMATHGQFSSSNEDTFVLTWNDRLNINTLNNLLQMSELNDNGPIELLVLSACETATGDKQAALGMAGMAVRSGARSTIATLWQVNDEATAELMSALYEQLSDKQITKSEALRQAQLKVLQNPQYRQHPYYWSSYILVGNWL